MQISDAKARLFFEQSPDAVLIVDAESARPIAFNQEFSAILGYTDEGFTQLRAADLDTSETLEEFRKFIELLRRNGNGHFETTLTTKPGQILDVFVKVCRLQLNGRQVFHAIIRNISARKQAEEALRNSEYRYRYLYTKTPVMMHSIDKDGLLVDVNDHWLAVLGYERNEVVGQLSTTFLTEASKRYAETVTIPEFMKRGCASDVSYQFRKKNGEIVDMLLSAVTERDGEGKFVRTLAVLIDVTERKRAEERLHQYQEQLRSLASEISLAEEGTRRRIAADLHDITLQNLGLARIKLGALGARLSSTEHAGLVDELSRFVDQTIQETRSLAFEISPPILYELGFLPALEWLAERVRERHGIDCRVEHGPEQEFEQLDDDIRIALFQAVRELLINVRKHAQATQAKIDVRRKRDQIQISVEDDGVGFDTSQVNDRVQETGGFGIFSIRECLKLLSGHLDVRSDSGHGTRVFLNAPLTYKKR